MQVEQRDIGQVIPYERNPRRIPDSAVSKVAASIREFGFQQPIVIDPAGVVIVGHARLKAAQSLGLATVPVVVADLPEAKARAYRLADNRTNQEASWLDDLLGEELEALKALDFDLSLTGFDDRELQALLVDEADLARAEETPAVPVNPVTIKGDVWLLGNHRLVCGDATVASDVGKALSGVKPHLVVTDPPYGVNYDPTRTSDNKAKSGKVLNDDRADWTEAWALFPGDVAYIWHASTFTAEVIASLESVGLQRRAMIIWAKDRADVRGDRRRPLRPKQKQQRQLRRSHCIHEGQS